MNCPHCGTETTPGILPQEVQVGAYLFRGPVAGFRCPSCGEVAFDGPSLVRFDLMAARRLAEIGARSGPVFKFMRKSIGLSAETLASLLGVSTGTLSRWENGHRPIERSAVAALGTLVVEHADGRDAALRRLWPSDRAIRACWKWTPRPGDDVHCDGQRPRALP
jgi:transcriptional regulator with XRE-family HTH domain